jgi:potassium efflux system protein
VAQYVLFIVGVVLAFGELRIGWGKLQWLVAGLSVGVGFGLQEIVANFISGVTLLFERPIRIGTP